MTSPARRAILSTTGLVALALALTVALAGCSSLQNLRGHLSGQTVTPRAGDCWRVTYSDAAQSEDWEGSGAVACSTTHQSYTYAVTRLTKTFTGSWLGSDGNPRTDVDTAAFNACLASQKRLLPGITPKEALFYPTYYVPSVAQWNAGARWVRCDMTEINVGSQVAKPSLTRLPTNFSEVVSALAANPKRFALCEDDPFNNGPDGAGTTYADCTKPADWTFEARITLPGGAGASYPGAAALKALGAQKCAAAVTDAAGHDVVAKTPSESDWVQNDNRALDCWLNNN
ncbi:MAG TPA: septum formation family protein [Galbitalea sp.]